MPNNKIKTKDILLEDAREVSIKLDALGIDLVKEIDINDQDSQVINTFASCVQAMSDIHKNNKYFGVSATASKENEIKIGFENLSEKMFKANEMCAIDTSNLNESIFEGINKVSFISNFYNNSVKPVAQDGLESVNQVLTDEYNILKSKINAENAFIQYETIINDDNYTWNERKAFIKGIYNYFISNADIDNNEIATQIKNPHDYLNSKESALEWLQDISKTINNKLEAGNPINEKWMNALQEAPERGLHCISISGVQTKIQHVMKFYPGGSTSEINEEIKENLAKIELYQGDMDREMSGEKNIPSKEEVDNRNTNISNCAGKILNVLEAKNPEYAWDAVTAANVASCIDLVAMGNPAKKHVLYQNFKIRHTQTGYEAAIPENLIKKFTTNQNDTYSKLDAADPFYIKSSQQFKRVKSGMKELKNKCSVLSTPDALKNISAKDVADICAAAKNSIMNSQEYIDYKTGALRGHQPNNLEKRRINAVKNCEKDANLVLETVRINTLENSKNKGKEEMLKAVANEVYANPNRKEQLAEMIYLNTYAQAKDIDESLLENKLEYNNMKKGVSIIMEDPAFESVVNQISPDVKGANAQKKAYDLFQQCRETSNNKSQNQPERHIENPQQAFILNV